MNSKTRYWIVNAATIATILVMIVAFFVLTGLVFIWSINTLFSLGIPLNDPYSIMAAGFLAGLLGSSAITKHGR